MATAAAITSTSSSIKSVASSKAVSNQTLQSLAPTTPQNSLPITSTKETNLITTSASISASVASTSSRSRRNKISHYYHNSPGTSNRILSNTAYPNRDSKSMQTSNLSHSASSKASNILAGGGSLDTISKSKTGQRKWKEESSCKTKSLKWKSDIDNPGLGSPDLGEKSSSRSMKWKVIDKSKLLSGNLYKMKGLKWKAFSEDIGQCEEDLSNLSDDDDETVLRLDQSDMGLYGLCPETDPFYAVICDICNAVVKPQGLQKHMIHRHYGCHSSKHHIQHSILHHRHILSGYSSIASCSHPHRILAEQPEISLQSSSAPQVILQMTSSDRQSEKSINSIKASTRDSSPAQMAITVQHTSRSIGTTGIVPSSNSSKSKSKSTSKVKSKSGKSCKTGKSENPSSNHSSAAPSPSSSSSSSFSAASGRNGSNTTNTASNGITHATNSEITATSTCIGVSGTLPYNSASGRSIISGQLHVNEKQNKTAGNAFYSTSSNATQNNVNSPSKKGISLIKQNDGLDLSTSNTASHGSNVSLSSNPSVTSLNSCLNNPTFSTVSAATSRRAYSRYKSSSADRKNVPVKEREYDANKHCGVTANESSRPCTRSLTCKAHSLSMRRMVSGRSKSFDKLLADHRASKEIPQSAKPRTLLELDSSNSSSSMDLDRRSVSSNSNLSVEVQASSTSSQSSLTTTATAEPLISGTKQSIASPPLTTSAVVCSSNLMPSGNAPLGRDAVDTRLNDSLIRQTEESDPFTTETVQISSLGQNNPIQINISPDGTPQITQSPVTRRNDRRSNADTQSNRITTRVIDTNESGVPPELLDDSKFSTNIFSPESTVLSGPIRFLAEDLNDGCSMKRFRHGGLLEFDISKMSEERKLQLMVQRKVNSKNRIAFRDRNRPGPTAITIPPAAEIVAQAFAEENPNATLTDAQVIMDPETKVVSVSVCGTFHPDNMQLNWAPFNQEFMSNTLSRALSPYGITVQSAQPGQTEQMHVNPNLMPNPEDEGFQIHHLPPLTEEEYNQMRPEFVNGMPKPSMLGCPGIKTEIKQEVEDLEANAILMRQPILPMIKQGNIKEEIKMKIKEEPLEIDTDKSEVSSEAHNTSETTPEEDFPSDIPRISSSGYSADVNFMTSEPINDAWVSSPTNVDATISSDNCHDETVSESSAPMSLELDVENDDSDMELLQPIASCFCKTSAEHHAVINGKENSNSESDDRNKKTHGLSCYGSEDAEYRNEIGSNFYYGRLPRPNHVNTFGLLKLRGSTNFKKSILCTRRANSSIHAYQTLFHGVQGTFFRRDNSLGSKHCTVDSNGAISVNGNNSYDASKMQSSSSPSGMLRSSSTPVTSSLKNIKTSRRLHSGHSPNNMALKRQASNYISSSTNTQTPAASPFYRKFHASSSGNKIRLQKRSIIMNFRGNGSGQQHLSKTCAILQSQIVNKLAEQLLGFKRVYYQRSANIEPIISPNSVGNSGAVKQSAYGHLHNMINCKLSPCKSSVSSLIYQSTSSEKSLPAVQATPLLNTAPSLLTPLHQQQLKLSRTYNAAASYSNSNSNNSSKAMINPGLSRISNAVITQRYSPATPVAIVAPLTSHASSGEMEGSMSSIVSNNGGKGGTPPHGRNSGHRSNPAIPSSSASISVLNGGGVKANANNTNGVN